MSSVSACAVPDGSLLDAYRRNGSYADCFVTEIARTVSHAEYVEAFYTTALFKLERFILAYLAAAPSTDSEARELALGERESFAAWRVEGRSKDQLLVAAGRTRSWFKVESSGDGTRLYFGSAVVPKVSAQGHGRLGLVFAALLGFHKLYSRALLRAARARLQSN